MGFQFQKIFKQVSAGSIVEVLLKRAYIFAAQNQEQNGFKS
jgi:hypothetical protein